MSKIEVQTGQYFKNKKSVALEIVRVIEVKKDPQDRELGMYVRFQAMAHYIDKKRMQEERKGNLIQFFFKLIPLRNSLGQVTIEEFLHTYERVA